MPQSKSRSESLASQLYQEDGLQQHEWCGCGLVKWGKHIVEYRHIFPSLGLSNKKGIFVVDKLGDLKNLILFT